MTTKSATNARHTLTAFVLIASLALGALLAEGVYRGACGNYAYAATGSVSSPTVAEVSAVRDSQPAAHLVYVADPTPVTAPAPATASGSASGTSGAATFPTAPADPVAHPAQAYQEAKDVYAQLGIGALVVLLLFQLTTLAAKNQDMSHWLNGLNGRLGAVVGVSTGVLGLVGGALAHQVSWAAVLTGVISAVFAVLHPAPATKPSAAK